MPRSRRRALLLCLLLAGCGGDSPASGPREVCGPYPDWRESEYLLPYPVGTSYTVSQGNCTAGGHRGRYRHSYDFAMPIGTVITAARSGTVTFVEEGFGDDTTTIAENNFLVLRHADGLFTAYSHLTRDGALVAVGDAVEAGEPIALSGNSGYTGGFPHLHFHLEACGSCVTLPVTFRNTAPNPAGLQQGIAYPAHRDRVTRR